jgi:hypothetical protein
MTGMPKKFFRSLDRVKELYYISLIYEINKAKDKLAVFETKYAMDFLSFEKSMRGSSKEDFARWDDYMEWKAYHKSYEKLMAEKKDFDEGNIRITQ